MAQYCDKFSITMSDNLNFLKGKQMIYLTDAAKTHVKNFLTNRGKGVGIRVGVKTAGCSGLAYVLEFVDDVQPEDHVFDNDGVSVFVDPKSLVYLDGLQMDYVKNGLNEGFEFNNPNKEGECGCGESFTV